MSAKDPHNEDGRRSLPDDLYDYVDDAPSRSRRPNGDPSPRTFHVTDDWPEDVPVTEAEIDVFERYFGNVLDRLFGLAGAEGKDLKSLSQYDNETP